MSRPSVARALQLEHDQRDDQLTLRARVRRPLIKHWWGRQPSEAGAGALCYLCDTMIATWSSRWPMTDQARAAVAVHRDLELRRLLDQPAGHTVEERP